MLSSIGFNWRYEIKRHDVNNAKNYSWQFRTIRVGLSSLNMFWCLRTLFPLTSLQDCQHSRLKFITQPSSSAIFFVSITMVKKTFLIMSRRESYSFSHNLFCCWNRFYFSGTYLRILKHFHSLDVDVFSVLCIFVLVTEGKPFNECHKQLVWHDVVTCRRLSKSIQSRAQSWGLLNVNCTNPLVVFVLMSRASGIGKEILLVLLNVEDVFCRV